MDCEKFDQHVIDALYDELDELTHAALKRHVEGCSRCAGVYSSLKATRAVGVLPLEEPPDGLEARILEAVSVAQRKTPWHKKVLRGLAWAGSHAMRPQLAMAALFFLVIGSSLLLLRARPGVQGAAPVSITERGAPAPEPVEMAAAAPQQAAAPPPAATAAPVAAAEMPADRSEKQKAAFGGAKDEGGRVSAEAQASAAVTATASARPADAAQAALADARAVRDGAGCGAAVGKFDDVGVRFPGTGAAADAMWDAASCYKAMGRTDKARELYTALRSTSTYRERADKELGDGNANSTNIGNQVAVRAAPPAPAPAPRAAAAPRERMAEAAAPSAKPAAPSAGGSRAPAAPAKKAADRAVGF